MERLQSHPPEGNKGKFINAKRVGILAIIGIGLIAAYKCNDRDVDKEEASFPVATPVQTTEDHTLEIPPLTRPKSIANEERIRGFLKSIQMPPGDEILDDEPEPGKINPSAHFSLLSELIGEETDRLKLNGLLQAYETFTKCYAKGRLSGEDLITIILLIENYAENGIGSEINLDSYTRSLKKCKLIGEAQRQDKIRNDLNVRIKKAIVNNWISGHEQSELYHEFYEGSYGEVKTILDELIGNRERIDMILGNMFHHSGISDNEHTSRENGYIKKSEWEHLSNMPTDTYQDVLEKLVAAEALSQIIVQRFRRERLLRSTRQRE